MKKDLFDRDFFCSCGQVQKKDNMFLAYCLLI